MRILVIGDSCDDTYIYGQCDRLCPDAPIAILKPKYEIKSGGMAKNVLMNLLALDCDADLITNKNKILKIRYVDDKTNQMLVRIDTGEDNIDRILGLENIKYKEYNAIIISDYCKGFLEESDIEFICKNHKNVLIDTKRLLGDYCKNAKFIKINEYEYEQSLHLIPQLNISDLLLITLGSRGCQYKNKIYNVNKVDIKDQTGAGDSFIAAFMTKYIENNNIDDAINYANLCATQVVQLRGVAVINKNLL